MNTVDLFRSKLDGLWETTAYVHYQGAERHDLTFGQWWIRSRALARDLHERGVGRGDVVLLLADSGCWYAISYLACMHLGAICSGVNPRLGPKEMSHIFFLSKPKAVIVDAQNSAALLMDRLVVGEGHFEGPVIDLPDLVQNSSPEAPGQVLDVPDNFLDSIKIADRDLVALVWTSGTTGLPKGCLFSHANLQAVAMATGDLSQVGDRKLSPLPFSHVGYMTRLWDEIEKEITTVITPTPFKADRVLEIIVREKVTVAQGVPTQWHMMISELSSRRYDMSSLRIAGSGGASVSPNLVGQIREATGCPVIVGYASTETAVIAKSSINDTDKQVANTVGLPASGVAVSIVDDSGIEILDGRVGTVVVESAAVMHGYLGEEPLKRFNGVAKFATGDLGTIDRDGYISLVGRHSDMFIRGGYNIYPVELENTLLEMDEISQVAVVGVIDDKFGEVGYAFVVGKVNDEDQVKGFIRSNLASYKVIDKVVFLDVLPTTSMGKVDKLALKNLATSLKANRGL